MVTKEAFGDADVDRIFDGDGRRHRIAEQMRIDGALELLSCQIDDLAKHAMPGQRAAVLAYPEMVAGMRQASAKLAVACQKEGPVLGQITFQVWHQHCWEGPIEFDIILRLVLLQQDPVSLPALHQLKPTLSAPSSRSMTSTAR